MTAIRPHLLKLLVPLAAFGFTLALIVSFGGGREVELRESSGGAVSAADFVSLGDTYLQKARDNGDPGNYDRAERSFDAALRREPRNVDALLGAGELAGLRHDFGEQLRLGLDARRLMPELVSPYPVIADAQIELGRYGAAERTLQRLLDLKPNLTSYSRVSYYRELRGDLDGAAEAMQLAASAGAGAPENLAYVQVLLGDLELQRGRTGAARLAYTAALRSLPGYPAGMVGLARADAAGGDLGRAAARLRRASERLPLIATLTLLAQVERELDRPDAAAAALDGARAQQQLYAAAATEPDAESVLFEADYGDPQRAVVLGRRVWERAPSIRSADALGWAHVGAGDAGAGVRWARRALATGSRDPLFNLHAAVALERAGRSGEAERHYELARRGRAALSPSAAALLEEGLR
jgi:tetratricopeptide (TPR) repeat protein